MDGGRRAHYGEFYGVPPSGPLVVVHGNCQAESLRVVLAGSSTFPYRTVRIPPVHEVVATDLPPLYALLARTAVLLSQPVRDDYRDLPLGTAQLAARLPSGSRVLRWPVIRYAGLHPYSAIVRHPSDMSAVPPVVPYHDLRTLAVAAGHAGHAAPGPDALRAAAAGSVADLARREHATDVGVSDLLLGLGVRAAHTVNHPGNPVLVALAGRLQERLGAPRDAADPGRDLLGGIRAPLEEPVLAALGLDGRGLAARGLAAVPRPHWLVDGREVADDTVRAAQLDWYWTHPQWIEAGLNRYRDRMTLLGVGR